MSNMVSMIIVSLISAFLAAYLTNYFREKADAKRAHLESLKRVCLALILKELRNLRSYFIPDESYLQGAPGRLDVNDAITSRSAVEEPEGEAEDGVEPNRPHTNGNADHTTEAVVTPASRKK